MLGSRDGGCQCHWALRRCLCRFDASAGGAWKDRRGRGLGLSSFFELLLVVGVCLERFRQEFLSLANVASGSGCARVDCQVVGQVWWWCTL